MKISIRMHRLALLAICSLGILLPTESFATLNDVACRALHRSCYKQCAQSGGKQTCYDFCDDDALACHSSGLTKQQTPPPPCTGVRCTLPKSNPPTTVGPPARKPRPVQPAKPVGVSNPGNPNSGNNGPVILLRKNNSGGSGH
jgi:hypothetical protein